jgi:hypothetical protein
LEQKLTVEECLAKKGYESEPQPSSDKEKSIIARTAKRAEGAGGTFLVILFYTALVAGGLLLLML